MKHLNHKFLNWSELAVQPTGSCKISHLQMYPLKCNEKSKMLLSQWKIPPYSTLWLSTEYLLCPLHVIAVMSSVTSTCLPSSSYSQKTVEHNDRLKSSLDCSQKWWRHRSVLTITFKTDKAFILIYKLSPHPNTCTLPLTTNFTNIMSWHSWLHHLP